MPCGVTTMPARAHQAASAPSTAMQGARPACPAPGLLWRCGQRAGACWPRSKLLPGRPPGMRQACLAPTCECMNLMVTLARRPARQARPRQHRWPDAPAPACPWHRSGSTAARARHAQHAYTSRRPCRPAGKLVCHRLATPSLCARLHQAPCLREQWPARPITPRQSCAPSGWMLSADALTPTPPGASWTAQGAQLRSSLMMEKPWVLEEMLALASWKNCARPNSSALSASAGALGSKTLDGRGAANPHARHGHLLRRAAERAKHWRCMTLPYPITVTICWWRQVHVAVTLQNLILPHPNAAHS